MSFRGPYEGKGRASIRDEVVLTRVIHEDVVRERNNAVIYQTKLGN